MSLFGGDSPAPQPPRSESSFSISPISSRETSPITHTNAKQDHDGASLPGEIDSLTAASHSDDADATNTDVADEERARFAGSDNLWRYYARDEIAIAKSLDQLRANDLAAHLYNAHAWKAGINHAQRASDDQPQHRNSPVVERDAAEWYPDSLWTRWPLEPDQAPLPQQAFWSQEQAGVRTATSLALSEMRAHLQAAALARVKSQWVNRPSISPVPARRCSRSPSVVSQGEPSSSDISSEDDEVSVDDQGSAASTEADVPVLSADDERSEALLRPAVSSVLYNLDDLLRALHHSRAGHYAVGHDDMARSLRGSSLSRSRSRSVSYRARRNRSISAHQSDSDISDAPTSKRPKSVARDDTPEAETRGRSARPGLVARRISSDSADHEANYRAARDWNEVIAMAATVGWPAEVIEKARVRCQRLFGQEMHMDIPHESDMAQELPSEELELKLEGTEKSLVKELICPEPDCLSQISPFPITKAFRLREHLKRVHKYSSQRIQEVDAKLGLSREKATKNPMGWTAPDPLQCPHSTCRDPDKIYASERRLLEHIQRFHKYDPRQQPAVDRSGQDKEESIPISSELLGQHDFMVGGVHNDGFMQPIAGNLASKRQRLL